MLATIIHDAYKETEKKELASAIQDICDASDNYGWASAGVYCFWDFATKEVLYIGLAVDLAQRFRQHNGLIPCRQSQCKIRRIRSYFSKSKILGYSIFVQSPISQPRTAQAIKSIIDPSLHHAFSTEGEESIWFLEGLLLASFKLAYNRLPFWNKIGGLRSARKHASVSLSEVLRWFAGGQSELVARATIRELSNESCFCGFEELLHAARMLHMQSGRQIQACLERFRGKSLALGEMERVRYLDRSCPFS